MCLSEVTLYSFGAVRAVLVHIGVDKARPAGIVACFDGGQPVDLTENPSAAWR